VADALAAVVPPRPAAGVWASYVANCTFWNHVRTAAAIAAATAFTLALLDGRGALLGHTDPQMNTEPHSAAPE
jgi:hypothetical protein